MNPTRFILPALLGCALLGVQPGQAQEAAKANAAPESKLSTKNPYYLDLSLFDVRTLVADAPALSSAVTQSELAELHHIQDTRTPQQVAAAEYDEEHENIFLFSTLLGGSFTPEAFPATAALSARLKNEQGAVGSRLKESYKRLRPYQADTTLHPVCAVKPAHDSYPSGHALTGYLEALALAELLPDKRDAILARADDYAHNRLVCGVHYASDTEASRRIAYAIFGYIQSTPKFQQDLAAARTELAAKLSTASAPR